MLAPGFTERLTAGRPGRLVLGVLAAALVACLTPLPVLLLTSILWDAGAGHGTPLLPSDFAVGSVAMIAVFPVALLMTVAGGLPVHLILAALNQQSRWAYALGGGVAGGLLLSVFLLGKPLLAVSGVLAGGLAALTFRSIWRP